MRSLVSGSSLSDNVIANGDVLAIRLLTIVGIVLINRGQRRISGALRQAGPPGPDVGGDDDAHPAEGQQRGHDPADLSRCSIMSFPGMIANFLSASNQRVGPQPGYVTSRLARADVRCPTTSFTS